MPERATGTGAGRSRPAREDRHRRPARPAGQREPVAVIGAGVRFPGGSDTLEDFTAFLRAGRSGIRPLPEDRWRRDPVFSGDQDAARTAVRGGFLDRIDEFDAPFFNISAKQAPLVDPHQRLLLETAWAALESASIDPAALRHGDAGVYIGATPVDFTLELASLPPQALDGSLATGMGGYSLSGRLSYFLGWRGPSLTVDTACASSLTALHLAVSGLRNGETSVALCGAVNALHHPRTFAILTRGQMLAADGRCKAFDEAADGYARAEGCGVLVLKRLADALAAGDTILALVRGTAIGQDGESAGMTAPNGTAQEGVMRAALANAGLQPGDISYVEAHGTGTPLGDPIEMGSINGVFGGSHDSRNPVTVASLKSNLGHMEAAAGIGAVVKVILQLQAGQFFPHLIQTPSGRIPWDTYPVTIPVSARPWRAPVRRAMVNGFGVAGAIGIAVLEEAPGRGRKRRPGEGRARAQNPARQPGGEVFTLSAKSGPALRMQMARYRDYLAEHSGVRLDDLCYTRNTGRSHFRYRMAAVVGGTGQLTKLLDERLAVASEPEPAGYRKVAMLFPGSGSQYPGMGSDLYERFPTFRAHVEECDELMAAHLGRSVADIMLGRVPGAQEVLARTVFTHAALFALEYALAKLWLSWGIRPSVLLGHSVGEVVAATVAGLFSLPDGVAFLMRRAELIESAAPGGMAAVTAPVSEITPVLAQWRDLAVAAINAPAQCVISGAAGSLAAATAALTARGIPVRPLRVATAFHSPLVAGIAGELRAALSGVQFHEPALTIMSNLTGAVAPPRVMGTPDYWARHAGETVNFAAGARAVGKRGKHVFLEAGPSMTLTVLARECLPGGGHTWLSCLHPRDQAGEMIDRALAGMYTAGLSITWAEVYAGRSCRRMPLPGYVFDRHRYGLPARDVAAMPDSGTASGAGTPALPPPKAAGTGGTGEAAGPGRCGATGDFLRNAVADLVSADGPQSIDPHATFLELGIDSIAAVKLMATLETHVGLPVTAADMFDHPSVDELAAFIDGQLAAGGRRDGG